MLHVDAEERHEAQGDRERHEDCDGGCDGRVPGEVDSPVGRSLGIESVAPEIAGDFRGAVQREHRQQLRSAAVFPPARQQGSADEKRDPPEPSTAPDSERSYGPATITIAPMAATIPKAASTPTSNRRFRDASLITGRSYARRGGHLTCRSTQKKLGEAQLRVDLPPVRPD